MGDVMDDQKEQDRIRRRAYEIWERDGSPDGRAEEFWQQAISSLEAEDAQGIGSGQPIKRDADAARSESERRAVEQRGATGK